MRFIFNKKTEIKNLLPVSHIIMAIKFLLLDPDLQV